MLDTSQDSRISMWRCPFERWKHGTRDEGSAPLSDRRHAFPPTCGPMSMEAAQHARKEGFEIMYAVILNNLTLQNRNKSTYFYKVVIEIELLNIIF